MSDKAGSEKLERRRAQFRASYYKRREKVSAQKKAAYHANPEAARARNRARYAETAERRRVAKMKYVNANRELINSRKREQRKSKLPPTDYLRRNYGLSLEEYKEMLKKQRGVCAICLRPEKRRRLAVDHCHDTGRVRGLLCARCNTGIGNLDDSAELLRRAVEYLDGGQ